jgi:outer membrane protein assembly factor BamE (lipoprotein component of BamABCDE complex)|tara:strand:+ start:26 stop:496 length:471 start_codon:yes stop_codon:yes gene_type:complete
MKNYLFIFISFFLISNCTLNKVIKHHGVHFLEKKHVKLTINKSNKNDIMQLLGPPSTSSTFDKDLWIYIERNTSSSKISKLGKKTLLTNNVLLIEIDNRGLLVEKIFLNKEDMQNLKFSNDFTEMSLLKRSFVVDFLSSVRQKMNDPLGKKRTRKD